MKKILIKAALALILIGLISCFTESVILAESTKEIRLRYDSKATIFCDLFTHSRLKDSVEYYEWTDYKNGKPILRIKIEGEFVSGYKAFINLSFDKETGQEDSSIVIRKIVTEGGKKRVVASEKDFQRSFAGIITTIQYLRTHKLKVGEKRKVDVIANKEGKVYFLMEVKDEKSIKIGDFNLQVYVIKAKVTNKDGKIMSDDIEGWFIKEGKFAGCIARLKIPFVLAGWVRLTLNKAFISNR